MGVCMCFMCCILTVTSSCLTSSFLYAFSCIFCKLLWVFVSRPVQSITWKCSLHVDWDVNLCSQLPIVRLLWFAGDFLVSIEHLSAQYHASIDEDVDSVRVYTNLHCDVTRQPISASVAGQIRSMRLDGPIVGGSSDRLNVIEIPLKASPKSIAVNTSMCHFAIGLQTHVLVYGLSSTKVAGSQRCFRWLWVWFLFRL